uniref:Uncharacterized protein MANES_04G140300 n=1 Tax=Rhizophora mucronata TaxID=61149 RepID=A0A2P2M5I3_RHIMU
MDCDDDDEERSKGACCCCGGPGPGPAAAPRPGGQANHGGKAGLIEVLKLCCSFLSENACRS